LIAAVGIDIDDRVQEIVELARNQAVAIREVPRHKLDSLSGITNHQGIALVAKPFAYSSQKEMFARVGERPLFVAVDGVTDPRNIGAIIRSAVAFGADGIFIPERRNASITGAAWKASAGAVARVPIAQVTNLVRSIEDAKKLGCFVVGLDSDAKDDVASISVASEGLYLVVGGEGKGLSRLVREHCDLIASIPISTKVESLNASVATSIALYEIAKRRASNE
jgi:23S rRNA (guanosine2251-2'-O)-methyltransferase